MRKWRLLAVVTLAFAAVPVLAQDQSVPESGGTPDSALICMNAGNQYKVGEFACVAACRDRRRLARCDIVAEAASWTYVSEACPSAMIVNPPLASDLTGIPAVSAMNPKAAAVNMTPIPADAWVKLAAALRRPAT